MATTITYPSNYQDTYSDAGVMYPVPNGSDLVEARLQELADKYNNGEIGERVRVDWDNRGTEWFICPSIEAWYKTDYA